MLPELGEALGEGLLHRGERAHRLADAEPGEDPEDGRDHREDDQDAFLPREPRPPRERARRPPERALEGDEEDEQDREMAEQVDDRSEREQREQPARRPLGEKVSDAVHGSSSSMVQTIAALACMDRARRRTGERAARSKATDLSTRFLLFTISATGLR